MIQTRLLFGFRSVDATTSIITISNELQAAVVGSSSPILMVFTCLSVTVLVKRRCERGRRACVLVCVSSVQAACQADHRRLSSLTMNSRHLFQHLPHHRTRGRCRTGYRSGQLCRSGQLRTINEKCIVFITK